MAGERERLAAKAKSLIEQDGMFEWVAAKKDRTLSPKHTLFIPKAWKHVSALATGYQQHSGGWPGDSRALLRFEYKYDVQNGRLRLGLYMGRANSTQTRNRILESVTSGDFASLFYNFSSDPNQDSFCLWYETIYSGPEARELDPDSKLERLATSWVQYRTHMLKIAEFFSSMLSGR